MTLASFKGSDQVVALRRLAKAAEAIVGKLDREKVAEHARNWPGTTGPAPHYTAARTRELIDALAQAKAALDQMK